MPFYVAPSRCRPCASFFVSRSLLTSFLNWHAFCFMDS